MSRVALSDSDKAAVLELPSEINQFARNRYIIKDGQTSEYCTVPVSGLAFRYKITSKGSRQIVAVIYPGDIIEFHQVFSGVTDHSVQALTQCDVAFIHQVAFRALVFTRPAIANALTINTLIDASIYREWIVNIGRRDARAKVAHFICEFASMLDAKSTEPSQPYRLPMTQEQIGDAVGLTGIHVNRTMRGLIKDGLLQQAHRVITIPSWDLLKAESGFNRRYLNLEAPALLASN